MGESIFSLLPNKALFKTVAFLCFQLITVIHHKCVALLVFISWKIITYAKQNQLGDPPMKRNVV